MTGAREVRARIHGYLKREHRKSRAHDDEVRADPG